MNHLSLFSGIGGLDLAAEWAGFKTVAFVERDAYCQRVLARHWPGVPCLDDVRRVVADADNRLRLESLEPLQAGGVAPSGSGEGGPIAIELVSGGFPCQPHSVAGKRQASADDRDLWPEFARVIRVLRPRWVVAENVPGLLHSESGRFFGRVLGDLADLGYSAGWGVWGASDVGAPHRRERVFIVANAGSGRLGAAHGGEVQLPRRAEALSPGAMAHTGEQWRDRGVHRPGGWGREPQEALRDAGRDRWEEDGVSIPESLLGRVADGIPSRVDRLRALGNAVVPQQAYPLFAAIARAEGMN